MIDQYDHYNGTILGVQKVSQENVNKYGIVKGKALDEHLYMVEDLVEKPSVEEAPSNVAILGRYIITPEIFPLLEKTQPGALKALAKNTQGWA